MCVVLDSIASIGVAAAWDRISGVATEREARKQLKQYLQRKERINEFCTKEEEVDFQGLAEYIQTDMIEDVRRRLFGRTRDERKEARKTIRHKAMEFASNTAMSRDRAADLATKAIEILHNYHWKKMNRDSALITAEIEDTLGDEMAEQFGEINQKIGQENLLSTDHILSAINEGRFDEVATRIMSVQNAISSTHKLFPYYGYALKGGRYMSVPLTEEAEKIYPVHYDIKASSAWLGDEKIEKIDNSLLKRAYYCQTPLKLDNVSIKKYLGQELDPIQYEAEAVNGKTVTIEPPSFPEAFPCGIFVDDYVFFDDLRMRVKRRFEDGSVLLTNEEQENRSFDVSYTSFPNENRFELNLIPTNATKTEFLHYLEACERMDNGGEVRIKDLSRGELLDSGKHTETNENKDPRVIEILRKIIVIERYFNVELDCFRTIEWKDYNTVNRIYDVIEGNGCTTSTPTIDFIAKIEEGKRKELLALISAKHKLVFSTHIEVELFDKTLTIPLHREAPCVAVAEPEKILEKIKVLEVGDILKLTFVPGNSEKMIKLEDSLASENDNFMGLSYQPPDS